MIADQKIGKSFMGALGYNLKKLNHPDRNKRAELLETNFTSLTLHRINQEVDFIRQLRPNLNCYVYHTSLNFSNEEIQPLDNEKLLAIAHDYLEASGFNNNQYIIFRHYDAEHPHLHLLVNRICFDGSVVSDSNNYKKSEAILRRLEYQYNLIPVTQSNHITDDLNNTITDERYTNTARKQGNNITNELYTNVTTNQDNNITDERYTYETKEQGNAITNEQYTNGATEPGNTITVEPPIRRTMYRYNKAAQKAPTQNEVEMTLRTGRPSDKMLLQEKLKTLLAQKDLSLQSLVNQGELKGIHFLFNVASTGHVSGVTYFHGGFKIKGQSLGNAFKWPELAKKINYEQIKDGAAISEANSRTRTIYGTNEGKDEKIGEDGRTGDGKGNDEFYTGSSAKSEADSKQSAGIDEAGTENRPNGNSAFETEQDAEIYNHSSIDHGSNRPDNADGIQISDDIDDEAIHGRNRNRQRRARANRR